MGYQTLKDPEGNAIGYKAPPLPQYIKTKYRPKKMPCGVCGAAQRASKEAGCDYLPEMATRHPAPRQLVMLPS